MIKIYKVLNSKMILLFLFCLMSLVLSAQYNPNAGIVIDPKNAEEFLKNNPCASIDYAFTYIEAEKIQFWKDGHSAYEQSLIVGPHGIPGEYMFFSIPVSGLAYIDPNCYKGSTVSYSYGPTAGAFNYELTPFDIFTWNPYANGGTGAL